MKYNFKGTITELNEKGDITNHYSYYTNNTKVNIDDLKNILRLLENNETTLEREKMLREIKLIQKLNEIKAHLTFFSYNGCTERDCNILANDIQDFLSK